MGEETAVANGRIFDFQGLVTLTLTLDRVILHTVMHHSSTSTYKPNFIEIEETFCGRMYGRTFETPCIRSTQRSRPKTQQNILQHKMNKKLKPGLVASYDLRPGNGMGLDR